uniref:RING-type E3 ubiquitin transferase n=1 Tax=Schistosoma japonicum TaxID=6182 RepID=C1LMF9_SCHJA|nr:E3 ubiquitin-protein ligase synoviolin-B precursor [Schistosoma japonicum]CAX75888.1 E3 ubiquitin-protein ligase synoviolin-B precursor [Schistosoma japonicum]
MRYAILASASLIVSSIVVTNTYYRKKQFYPTVVYLTNSQPSLSILLFQCVVILFLIVKALTYAFFGRLQRAEVDNLVSQSWYAFFDMCLVFAFFQNELGVEFLFLFAILLFVRAFHWLLEERVDYMERSPVISTLFHLRIMTLITLLTLVDIYFIKTTYWRPASHGISVHLALGIEYFILILSLLSTIVRYILHSIDSMREHSWNKKATYLLYVDIFIGFIRLAVYAEFTFIMWSLHPFPLFIARPIYLSIRSLKKAIRDVLMSRRAIRYMNTVFRDATADDLAASSDTVCIICREEMSLQTDSSSSAATPTLKRLPCSHIFHVACLRSWFQRQQTCPTCRMDVIREARLQETHRQQPQRSATATTQPDNSANSSSSNSTSIPSTAANNQNLHMPWMPPPNAFPLFPPFMSSTSSSSTTQAQPIFPPMPPVFMPPFMGMPIVYPGNLFNGNTSMPEPPSGLPESTDEARLRASAEARFTALRQINILLNAAVLQMNAYLNAASAPSSESESMTSVLKADNFESKIEEEKVSSDDVNSQLGSDDKNIPTSANLELPEIRKHRLAHFKSSPSDINSQSNSELTNESK